MAIHPPNEHPKVSTRFISSPLQTTRPGRRGLWVTKQSVVLGSAVGRLRRGTTEERAGARSTTKAGRKGKETTSYQEKPLKARKRDLRKVWSLGFWLLFAWATEDDDKNQIVSLCINMSRLLFSEVCIFHFTLFACWHPGNQRFSSPSVSPPSLGQVWARRRRKRAKTISKTSVSTGAAVWQRMFWKQLAASEGFIILKKASRVWNLQMFLLACFLIIRIHTI